MYCVGCGKKLEEKELYCTNCGTKNENIENKGNNQGNTELLQIDNISSESVSNNFASSDNINSSNNLNNNSSTSNINSQNRWPQKLVVALIFGIIAMVLGPVFSVVTLILSIIGVVMAAKCGDQGSNGVAVIIVNVLGILSSLFGCFILLCIVFSFLYAKDNYSDKVNNIFDSDAEIQDKTSYIENTWYCGLNSNVDSSNYSIVMDYYDGAFEWKSKGNSSYIKGNYNIVEDSYGIYDYRLNYTVLDSSVTTSSGSYYYINLEKDKLQLYSSGSYKTYYCTTGLGSQNQL